MKRREEWNDGEGMRKWERCFDCGQRFHGAVKLALGWACWKTYLNRPAASGTRLVALGVLGGALRESRPKEALPVFEAHLALKRRYWSRNEYSILITQSGLASCLADLGRDDEALVLTREVYARMVAMFGISHEGTLEAGLNLSNSLLRQRRWADALTLSGDQLPAARRSLGADHDVTLRLNQSLAEALQGNPVRTRDDLRLNQHPRASSTRF